MNGLIKNGIKTKIKSLQDLQEVGAPENILAYAIVNLWVASWAAFPRDMAFAMSEEMEPMAKRRFEICGHHGCNNEVPRNNLELMWMGLCQTHYDEIETFDK